MKLKQFFLHAAAILIMMLITSSLLGHFGPGQLPGLGIAITFVFFLVVAVLPFFAALKLAGKKSAVVASLGCSFTFAFSFAAVTYLVGSWLGHEIEISCISLLLQIALWYIFFKKYGQTVVISLSITSAIILATFTALELILR